jgi:uncharacterized membrane protein
MKSHAPSSQVAACLLLAAAFGVVVYRAFVQPIAHDEALGFVWFLDGGVYKLLQFNSTNHVLFTLISKVFVKVFGVSEISIRTPSLIGSASFLITIYLLCRKIFENGASLLFAVAMLCLNPQIMDFMVAARGYSLGMACLCIAMYFLAKIAGRGFFQVDDEKLLVECIIASVFLALSVASNLTNLIPAFCLAVSLYAVTMHVPTSITALTDRTHKIFARYFLVPGVVSGLFILWPFLIQARPQQFRMGLPKSSEALRDVFNSSFLYKWTGDIYAYSLGATAPLPGSWQGRVSDFGVYIFLPLLFIFVLAGVILASRRFAASSKQQSIYCCLFGGAAISTVALTLILHILARVNYPVARTCLYFIPLFTLGGILSAKEFCLRFSDRLRPIAFLLGFAILCDYAIALNTKYFRYNAYDSISRSMFQVIVNDARSHTLSTIRVGGTWWYQPEIDFYRRRYKIDMMLPYDIKDSSYFWQTPNSLMPRDYSYFVFTPESDPRLIGSQVRVIFHDNDVGVSVIALDK